MARKILIVDDNAINRQMLINTLSGVYDIIEAENGKEALSLLHRNFKVLSAVLLDIVMPEMDGYEVLRDMRDNVQLSQIPVIMVTGAEDEESRVKALSLGANDFIQKPFNPEIVRHCLKNNIALRETASILNAIQKDKLTGLYNREAFFEKTSGMISDREPGYYVLSCFDIDNFKLINDQYGAAEGDRVLREIGKAVEKNAEEIGGVAGRISADNFAALFPANKKNTLVLQRILDKSLVSVDQQSVSFSIGRYVVTDLSLAASALYDRAFIAKQSVKGRYDVHLAYFDDAMLENLVRDQQITGEMETALAEKQFEAWYQPQYDHATGKLLGAEALARWRHPQKGIIPPGEFIPLFEQNGFVYELDKYIWRDVCRKLREWMDKGLVALPVSVNISRYDIFRLDLIDVLTGLIKEYDIPVDMLRLEVTESAFTSSTMSIVNIVKQLISLGFTVEIDDFGSGYSSLNTLKNVPAQVVKLDMNFLGGDDDSMRGGNILESIVRMTKWLGMTVLAEGVEELDQADFLKSIGCTYVQGYLYARPMPVDKYEVLLENGEVRTLSAASQTDDTLFVDAFWDPKSIDSVVFNKYSGGACVYEFRNGQIELVRVTDAYIHAVFGPGMTAAGAMKLDWVKHVDPKTETALTAAVQESIKSKKDVVGEYLFLDLPGCKHETWLRSSLRVIGSADDRHLVYCTSANITPQREAERRSAEAADRLRAVMNNVGCGVTAVTYGEDKIDFLLINDRYYELLGYTREQYEAVDNLTTVYADDRDWVLKTARRAYDAGTAETIEYRAVKRDGSVIWMRVAMTMTRFSGVEKPVQLCIFNDITLAREDEVRLRLLNNNLPGGIAAYRGSPDDIDSIRLTYFSDGLCKLLGYTRKEYEKLTEKDPFCFVPSEELPAMRDGIIELAKNGTPLDLIYHVKTKDNTKKWLNIRAVLGENDKETLSANAVFFDVTEQKQIIERLRVSEAVNSIAIRQSKNAVCCYDVASRRLTVSPNASEIFEMSPTEDDVPNKTVREGKISADTTEAYTAFYNSILEGKKEGSALYQRSSTRGWRWVEAHFSAIHSDDGKPVTAVITFADVTEGIEKDAAYKKWKQSFHDRAPDSYSLYHCNVSRNTVLEATEGLLIPQELTTNLKRLEERTQSYARQCVASVDRERFQSFLNKEHLIMCYTNGRRTNELEYREKLTNGETRWLKLTVDLIESPYSKDIEAYFLFENIDEAKRAQLEIIERAETDPLTGVLNRAAFAKKADSLIAAKPGTQHALIMLDVDGFKNVNDVFGHGAGDQILIDTAGMLRNSSRRDDLVGRLGGDEFVVFLYDIPNDIVVAKKAQQICNLTRKTLSVDVQMSGSVGIALYPQDGDSFEALYKKADETLYYVKGSGKNDYAFYRDEIETQRPVNRTDDEDERKSERDTAKRRMLIIGDNTVYELLKSIFEDSFRIEKATDENAALIKLRHFGSAISAILLDLSTPGIEGLEVLKQIQRGSDTKSIPVVVVSASEDGQENLAAIRAGAADFVTKPIDTEVLRIRLESAVSRADNERLRAQNSFLEMQGHEISSYRTVLERAGTLVVTLDWVKGKFTYSPIVSKELYGKYDGRSLWHIMLSDMVADSKTVKKMQQLVHDVANDRQRIEGRMTTRLKAVSGDIRTYEMNVYKQTNEFGLADRLVMTFNEVKA